MASRKQEKDTADGPESAGHNLLELSSSIVAAYVSNNPVPVGELPTMIKSVHGTLCGLVAGEREAAAALSKVMRF